MTDIITIERLESSIKDPADCKGLVALDELDENYGHHLPGNPADLWDWCLEQSRDELLALLAFAAAKSVNALQLPHYNRTKQRNHADRLATALNIDMAAWFTPTAGTYFGRISKAGIEEALIEAKGKDFASGIAAMKKAEAAAYAERQVEGTGWLPAAFRIATVEPNGEDDVVEQVGESEDDQSDEAALMEAAEQRGQCRSRHRQVHGARRCGLGGSTAAATMKGPHVPASSQSLPPPERHGGNGKRS